MVNTDSLVNAWVFELQQIPALVDALGGKERIVGYKDSFPAQSNLRETILGQPPGSILVVFMGTGIVRAGNSGAWNFRHLFKFLVRAPISADPDKPVSYAQLWSSFVTGQRKDDDLELLHREIHISCSPMDHDGPSSQRNQILVDPLTGETLDYFEFSASLVELGA